MAKKSKRRKDRDDDLMERIKHGHDEKESSSFRGALDPDKLKKFDVTIQKPKHEEHNFDIIPYRAGPNDPVMAKGKKTYTVEYRSHNNLGPNNESRLCLAYHKGEPCPGCEKREEMKTEGVDEDIYKAWYPRRRNLYNIVCYDAGEEDKGVQIKDVSYHQMEKFLIGLAKRSSRSKKKKGVESFIPFPHPKNGRTISCDVKSKKIKLPSGKRIPIKDFVNHKFEERDYTISKKILEASIPLDKLFYFPTYEEMAKLIKAGKKKGKKEERKKRISAEKIMDMKRSKLLDLIDDNDLDLDEDDYIELEDLKLQVIDDLGLEAPKKKKKKKEKKKKTTKSCPEGYVFGKDNNKYDECEDCDVWKVCTKKKVAMKAAKKKGKGKKKKTALKRR